MKHQIKYCKFCQGEALYIYLAREVNSPAAHKVVCNGCDYETKTYEYSTDALQEWNEKKDKANR